MEVDGGVDRDETAEFVVPGIVGRYDVERKALAILGVVRDNVD